MTPPAPSAADRGAPPEAAAPPPPEIAPLRPIKVFADGLGFFFRRFGSLAVIAAPGAALIGAALWALFRYADAASSAAFGVGVVTLGLGLFGGWVAGGAAHALSDLETKGRIRILASWAAIVRRPLALAGAGLMFAAAGVATVLVLASLVAFLLRPAAPLSLLAVLLGPALLGLAFARFGAVFWLLRAERPLGRALSEARALARGRQRAGLVPFALTLLIGVLLSPLFTMGLFWALDPLLDARYREVEGLLVITILAAPFALMSIVLAAMCAVYGRRLIELREGVAAENLAAVFE
ncbi:MAG: hypothetical protein AAFW46_17605 [Pseudomonadota bacterium]